MEFKTDIYISYTNKDNENIHDDGGWVTNFRKFLELLLVQILGESPSFLNYASQERPSSTELAKTAIFISIVSPFYVKNASCIEEIDDFYKNAKKEGSLLINGHERMFKVIKYPVKVTEEPTKIANLLEYDLYYTNQQTGEISEFHDFFNNDAERKFWLKLIDLAYDISNVIKGFRMLDLNQEDFDAYSNKNVYLAETGPDLDFHRDNIKRELTRHGFRVLPDHALPNNRVEMELAIKQDLERSRLSIHLIGDTYGELAPSSDKSILDIQNKLAGEHCTIHNLMFGNTATRFNRLIWISPDAQLHNDKQKIFVDNLRRELEDNEGADILQSPIEDFKMVVLEELLNFKIQKLRERQEKNNSEMIGGHILYLIYDKTDEYEAKKLAETFKPTGVNVISSVFDGNLLGLREIHLDNLCRCDSVVIYVNTVNDLWVQMKFLDLLKAPGLGRTKEELHVALVLGKSARNRVADFERYEVPVFDAETDRQNLLSNFIYDITQ